MRDQSRHTVPIQGIWEQVVGGAPTRYYTFNGQVVAMLDSSGAVVSRQDFDPWGKARGTSAIGQTSLNYTEQRLDRTGLRIEPSIPSASAR